MVRCLLITFTCLFSYMAHGQSYISNSSKKLKKCYSKAAAEAQKKEYGKAIKHCDNILKKEPDNVDALLRRGSYYFSTKALDKAEADFSKAIDLAPDHDARMYYTLALSQYEQRKFDQANLNFQKFISLKPASKKQQQKAEYLLAQSAYAAMAIKNPVPFNPIRLSDNINTTRHEYYPSITADNSKMIYLSRVGDRSNEDIYVSEFSDDQGYSKGISFEAFNIKMGEGAHCISADGKTIVLTSCDPHGGPMSHTYGSCDLFISYLQNGKWSVPENMGPQINSRAMDTQPNLTSDGKTLYFSSKRNGKSGMDIYRSTKLAAKGWTKPVRLTDEINTAKDEESPFMHPDGKTFYFRSNGLPGMGDFDIYYTQYNEENNTWGEVKNIGYPINTDANDGALFVSLDGTQAYYTSDRYSLENNLKPNLDIYRFELYPEARPTPTTYVKGVVKDGVTGKTLASKISINGNSKQRKVETDNTGSFLITLPSYENYAFNVQKVGYLFASDRFELKEVKNALEPYELEILLYPIPVKEETPTEVVYDKPIILKNVLFQSGSAVLLPESMQEINQISELLSSNPTIRISIYGHTDNVGNEGDNQRLSEQRAKAVHDELIKQGIDRNRLAFTGYGESQPISDNTTDEGRQQNRRTEFVVRK